MTFVIENVGHLPGIRTGADYLLLARQTIEMGNAEIEFLDTPTQIFIDGLPFYTQQAKVPLGNLVIAQKFFARRVGDYVLVIGMNYVSGAEESIVDEVFSTIRNINRS